MERLQQIAPERVDWVFEQTEKEADARRSEHIRVNTLVFVERMAGLIFALIVAGLGLGSSIYLAMHDHDVVAGVIGGTTLVGLVTAFISAKRNSR